MLEDGCRGDACFAEGIVTLIVYHLVFMVTQAGRWSRSRCKTNPVRVERETHIVPSSKGGVHPRAKFPAPSRKFPAPAKKFPAPLSREFAHKRLILPAF